MKRTLLTQFLSLFSLISLAQPADILSIQNNNLVKEIDFISKDNKITADSTWSILSTWNNYPDIKKNNCYYLYLYKDSIFGTVPLKVFIPKTYKSDIPSPVILILHGATVLSSFKDAYKDTTSDEDIFYNYFAKQNFIIVRPFADGYGPFADGTKNFDWVQNRFNGRGSRVKTNPTYNTLNALIAGLKELLNIDDNKVFAFGHSDGADGVFALALYKPSTFAGFMIYNSMLIVFNSYDLYLRNTVNRPLYIVHSDLDDLRPIQQTGLIIKILDSLKSPVLYKEYTGYQHYDKHLQKDLPYSYQWSKKISRNPFQKNVYWEISDYANNTCDWLKILSIDTSLPKAAWHTELNTKMYNKRDRIYMDIPYYEFNKSAAVNAFYNNNSFNIYTSRAKEIEILISPVMINLEDTVKITVNDRLVFNEKVFANKTYVINNFRNNFDRQALWVTSIKLKIE